MHVDAVAGQLDPAVAVDVKLPSGWAAAAAGRAARAQREHEEERASSRVPPRDRRPAEREVRVERERALEPARARRPSRPRQRSAIPRWKKSSASRVPEPKRPARVAQRLARSVRCARAPRRARRPPGCSAARRARAGPSSDSRSRRRDRRRRGRARGRLRTPFAAQQAVDRGEQLVLLSGQPARPAAPVEVAERDHELRQRRRSRPPVGRARSPVRSRPRAASTCARASSA